MAEQKKTLTECEEKFLEALAGEAKGDFHKAKSLAGYSPNTSLKKIVNSLESEIMEVTKNLLVSYGVKAAHTYNDVLEDKAGMNAREKINTASQILDRIGLVKKEAVEVEVKGATVVLLPPKETVDMDNLL